MFKMNNSSICIYLYSKFSNACKNFNNILDNLDDEILNLISLRNICIDNEKVRKTIINSEKISVQNVPCIIHITDNGQINNYEGEACFQFLNDVVGNYNEMQKRVEEEMSTRLMEEEKQQQIKDDKHKENFVEKNSEKEEDSDNDLSNQKFTRQEMQQHQIQQRRDEKKNRKQKSNTTKISELDDENGSNEPELDNEEIESSVNDENVEFFNIEDNETESNKINDMENSENVKKSINTGGGVMAAAMQMQKQREKI